MKFYQGEIAEVVIYDRALSPYNRARVVLDMQQRHYPRARWRYLLSRVWIWLTERRS